MRAENFVLPALCLGGAALLLAPARPTRAFSKIGGLLGEGQRDVRVFDNFADATANGNTTPAAQFPGYLGAELAVWKAIVEWGSFPHGDGTGDPSQSALGNGGANFDAMWSGNAAGVGQTNHNIISTITSCGGGTLAYTETPISDGWRIRFCDNWVWDDGPSTIGNRWDIQGVAAHEYGHALGLGHSVSPATMQPAVSQGSIGIRSIESDDIAGIQCIYGVKGGTKPRIVATVASSGALTIWGSNFAATGVEVWFTNASVTGTSVDPIVRVSGLSSSAGGTRIDLTIPGAAGPGDVMVNNPGSGNATMSNAFPTDLVGSFGNVPGPNISLVTPSTFDALIPGTSEAITISGTNLNLVTSVTLGGVTAAASRWTIVNSTTITLDPPQVPTLGGVSLVVSDGASSDSFAVTIVEPATPKYELGTGDPLNVVDQDVGFPFILSGQVGGAHHMYISPDNIPSSNMFASFDIGNNFTTLTKVGLFTIPAKGWIEIFVGPGAIPDPGPSGMVFYAQNLVFDGTPKPFPVSNLQSMFLVQ